MTSKHGVSGTFIRNLQKERRETGTLRGPRKRGKGRKPKIDRVRVQELVAADADATVAIATPAIVSATSMSLACERTIIIASIYISALCVV